MWSANVLTECASCHLRQVGICALVESFTFLSDDLLRRLTEVDVKKGDARARKFWNLKCGMVGLEPADLDLRMTWLRAQQYLMNQQLRITGQHAREKHRGEYYWRISFPESVIVPQNRWAQSLFLVSFHAVIFESHSQDQSLPGITCQFRDEQE